MYIWLLLGMVALVAVLLIWAEKRKQTEGFLTIDPATALAQRQQLQFEGEGRNNPLGRLQSTRTTLDADQVQAAIGQAIPVPTTTTSSLLTLLGFSGGLGATAPPSNGTGVEQTGAVQAKIDFCESLTTVDCDKLSDPRMAECGFCHRDGVNSKGNAHRGGMYISSDDQIRANEVANAAGVAAVYQPTVGSCAPKNMTLMKDRCQAREAQLQCQAAGAATLANGCGQCYGAQPANATGLVVMGPKPRQHTVYLRVSHPGTHSAGGAGLIVKAPSGTYTLAPSSKPVYDPQMLTLQITEGDALTITVFGVPPVWCGWMSSPDGNRVVSLDVGEQTIAPNGGMTIAGDTRSQPVAAAFGSAGITVPTGDIPNTVLWYMRRNEAIPPAVVGAWYGISPPGYQPAQSQGVDVSSYVKMAAGAGADFTVSNDYFQGDPAPNIPKNLWITRDDGGQLITPEGGTVAGSSLVSNFQMAFTMPASLVDPLLPDDKADCPTGPIVLTEIGAGLMGSHSCFGPGGAFNPTQYCLQELFGAAGGTPKGQAFPNTDAKVAALVQTDPTTDKPSLDATMAYLNNRANIAIYGVDMNGAPADFGTLKQAALDILGVSLTNPCDGPMAASGPHSPECLDYLWRTSGSATDPGGDPSAIPYQYCSAQGQAAPLNSDGSVAQANVSTANTYGSVAGVRQFFKSIYDRSQDSSNFDNQAAAMRNCFGVNITAPPETPAACPPPAPTEWLCLTQDMLQKPEVFQVAPNGGYNAAPSDAEAICSSYGARLATVAELTTAQTHGADWCSSGWVADDSQAYYPITTSTQQGCGNGATGVMTWTPSSGSAGVNCYGLKPPQGTQDILAFSGSSWNDPTAATAAAASLQGVPAVRNVSNVIQCASTDGQNCYNFPDAPTCQAWGLNPASNPAINQAAQPTTGIFQTDITNGGSIVGSVDNGALSVYYVPFGSNTAHWFPNCDVARPLNPCDSTNISETMSSDQFAAKYTLGATFQSGMGSPVDTLIRSRV
jgi:hypothetical protein